MAVGVSPFCQTCISNHKFYAAALADYLPEENNREYAQALANLPAFKKQIEHRYPLVCGQCAESVTARLKRNDYLAKSEALGLRIRAQQQRQSLSRNWVLHAIWFVRGILWISYIILMTAHLFYGRHILEDLCRRLYPWSFFVVFWDYQWYARQHAPLITIGKKEISSCSGSAPTPKSLLHLLH